MPDRNFISILLFILVVTNSSAAVPQQEGSKNVLILFSRVPSTPSYRVMLDGIRQKLTDEFGENYNLHMEYLETERYPKGNYPKDQFEKINKKYEEYNLDLLICIGPDIITTIRQNADSNLLRLPAISLDYDFSSYGYRTEISLNDETTVFPIKVDPHTTISAALSLFPDRRSVVIISGISNTDRIFSSITKEAVEQIKGDRVFSFLTDISMDEVLRKVRHLPPNSMIIIPYFNVDSKMVTYYNPESIRLISKSANVPVFAFSDMGLGDGTIGGYLICFEKIASKLGETAVSILNGADPNSIKLSNDDVYEYMYDWRELSRWKITDSDSIPKGSRILFREMSFFEKYKLFIISGSLFLLFQTILIFMLIMMVRRQKIMTSRLKEAENKYRELIHEDRILRLGQLTATLAHELNQPLTAILSSAQAGVRFIDAGNLDPALIKEIFKNIVEDDKRTASILSSIRGMMKMEKREKEIVNMNSLVIEVINIYRNEALEHKIKLDIRMLNTNIYVVGDRILLQQVIMNFILNAQQAMARIMDGNKMVTVTESIQQDEVIISVRDYGDGIDESLRANIFKPFVTSKKEGFGVGLAISRSIIEEHNGKIWAENKPDGGAEFSFRIKIHHVGE